MGGRRMSPRGEERWVYRLKILEESGIGLEKQMREQRKRASEAVRTSLRIFHLTEKIPHGSTSLGDADWRRLMKQSSRESRAIAQLEGLG